MASIIDDDMLDTFVPCGTYDKIADVIAARYQGITATINFPVPENPVE